MNAGALRETELRFQVPASARRTVEAAVATASAKRTRLQAIYFDTPDRRLAAAGLALRLRKEGRRWVQTLKAGGPYAMQRFEHNVDLPGIARGAGTAPLRPDPALHNGTQGGLLLERALAARNAERAPPLAESFRTDIQRWHRVVRARGGVIELAFDQGHLVAGARRASICELEFELLRGQPGAVINVARRWVATHGLWLEVRSKGERGERLARTDSTPAGDLHKATPLRLEAGLAVDVAFRAVVANCLDHLLPNASEVASGEYVEEHIHQWRVGLRRLRTALRFFEGWTPLTNTAWSEALAEVFEQLGTARDRDALTAAVVPDLREAGAPWVDLPSTRDAVDPVALARSGSFNQTVLALLGLAAAGCEADAAEGAPDFAKLAVQRLDAWQRQVRRDAKRFADLEDTRQHRLRRRIKRLRYAAEFVASLHPPKAVARYLGGLGPVQESLGRTNDVNVALALYRSMVDTRPAAWFAVGRLSAIRETLRAESALALKGFLRLKPFWRSD